MMAETDFRAAENSEDSKRCYTEAAEYINTYVQSQPGVRVILSGKDEALAQLRPWLSAPAQQLMLDRVPLNQRDTHDRILRVARAALEHHERAEEHADVDVLLGNAGRGGLAVLGLQSTLAAVNAGVVHRLISTEISGVPVGAVSSVTTLARGGLDSARCVGTTCSLWSWATL
jgi:hypothetical protein